MKAFLILASAMVLLSAQTCGVAHAQNRSWRVDSPRGGGFSVEVPAPLRRVVWFEGEHGATLEPDQGKKGASCYAVIETTPKDSRFGVTVISPRAGVSRPEGRAEFLHYLRIFVGDDDRAEPEVERAIRAHGLAGKEYFYMKKEDPLYTRGRIFDAGDRIYVVVFVGRTAEDLTSPDAERFLNSFRARARRKHK